MKEMKLCSVSDKYKDLVQSEIIYIRKNQEKIRKSAELIILSSNIS